MNQFYIAGGTLNPKAECYVERDADRELFDGLLRGEFCYVLTSRQMGKSSLMARTAFKLRKRGFEVVMIDLTAVGQNVSCEQWYDGLIMQVAEQLDLEDEVEDFWEEQERLSPIQRFIRTLTYVVLESIHSNLIIFIDEIDIILSLPFSADELFGAIRECYNRRTREPKFQRLDFCVLGVASPVDLINDASFSPFNSGNAITLSDFTLQDTEDLGAGLGGAQGLLWYVSHQIYMWTRGHPYLTLRLYKAMAALPAINGIEDVDAQCKELFLSEKSIREDANLIFVNSWLLRSQVESIMVEMLDLVECLSTEKKIAYDAASVIQKVVLLSGVAIEKKGRLVIRNPIYQHVFSGKWFLIHRPKSYAVSHKKNKQSIKAWKPYIRACGSVLGVVLVFGVMVQQLVFRENGQESSPFGEHSSMTNNKLTSNSAQPPESFSMDSAQSVLTQSNQGNVGQPDEDQSEYVPSDNELIHLARAVWDLGGTVITEMGPLNRSPKLIQIQGDRHDIWFNERESMPAPHAFAQLPHQHLIVNVNTERSPLTDEHLKAMAGWSNVSSLDIRNTLVSNQGLAMLVQFPRLHMLSVSHLQDGAFDALAQSATKVDDLAIQGSLLSEAVMSGFSDMSVHVLHLFGCRFSNADFSQFKQAHPSLEYLTILGPKEGGLPFSGLDQLTGLTVLELSSISLELDDFESIAKHPSLPQINLFDVQFEEEGLLKLIGSQIKRINYQNQLKSISENVASKLRNAGITLHIITD